MATDTETAERFERDTARHEMTVLHDDGLYRHLRLARVTTDEKTGRRSRSSSYWFELVTWPGKLAVSGDCGSFLFSRLDDMFVFFRSPRYGINPGYWSEKVLAGETTAYSADLFRQMVTEIAAEAEADWPGLAAAAGERIFGDLSEWNTEHEEGAREALQDFSYKLEGDRGEPFTFSGSWEWDLSDHHWQYLWCCHAIQFGIGRYDALKAKAG